MTPLPPYMRRSSLNHNRLRKACLRWMKTNESKVEVELREQARQETRDSDPNPDNPYPPYVRAQKRMRCRLETLCMKWMREKKPRVLARLREETRVGK
jgi:hypothetical protein